MKKEFLCFPEGKLYTIQELEKNLDFHFLSQIAFETPSEREEVREKGLDKLKKGGITQEALELGDKLGEKIEGAYIPAVSVRWLGDNLGHGLFAEEPLEEGSYVGEYTGIVRKNDRRYFAPLNNYCYEYPVPDYIGRHFVIDATEGNLTRFINHSFHPNLQPVHVFYEGFYHLVFFALERIEKGIQLCYNYGHSYWYVRNPPVSL
jgi:hypothetical protein